MARKLGLLSFGSFLLLFFLSTATSAQERTIRGRVTDASSAAPVENVDVSVQGTNLRVSGNDAGEFVLPGVPAGPVTLVVRRIGYRTTDVPVGADQTEVAVQLDTDYLRVDELVVTGRATAVERRNLAHAVAKVSGEEIDNTPQQTVDKALQGRIAGAVISRNSGAPGGGVQVQLRGASSINANAEPLYVVDGALVSNIAIASNTNAITGASSGSNPALTQDNQVNRIADLNTDDIESIEVLKGASAAAIYGSKASNGVVIITTRRGSTGAPQFRGRFDGGFFDLSNTVGSRRFRSAAEAEAAFPELGGRLFEAANGRVFDNEAELAGRNDFSFDASASVSGGLDDGLEYFGSALWKEDEGIVEGTFFEKQSARVNLATDFGDFAGVNLNTNLIRTQSDRGLFNNENAGSTTAYFAFASTPSFFDLSQRSDGTFPVNPFAGSGSNPLQTAALFQNDETVWRFLSSANVNFNLMRGERSNLDLNTNVGVDFFDQENAILSPPEIFFEDDDGLLGTSLLTRTDNFNLDVNTNLVYAFSPGSGAFTATTSLGAGYLRRELDIARIDARNLTGGNSSIDAGTQIQVAQQREQVEDLGLYLQEEFLTLGDRLLLTGAVLAEQSSANGDVDKLHFYPKASASYRFPEVGGVFNELKLRAAFGQTGNQPLYGQKFTLLEVDTNVQGLPVFVPDTAVGNAAVEPERQTEFEGGFDLTGFDGRARLEATGFLRYINDMVLRQALPPSTGFGAVIVNGGEVRSWGIETAVDVTPVATSGVQWSSRATFFLNRSEVTDLPGPSFVAGGFGTGLGGFRIEEGQSLTQIVGTDPTDTEDGLVKLGDAMPDFTVGLSNTLRVGAFSLYGLLDWRQGQDVVNLNQFLYDLSGNAPDHLAPDPGAVRPVEQCHPDCSGQERNAARALGLARPNVQSASFLKLREVALTYALSEGATRGLLGGVFDQVRLRASARDLFTVTDYEGLDPEVSNFGNQQIFRNIDVGPYPPSRSFWLGLDFTL